MADAAPADLASRRWVERLIADLCAQEHIVYTVVAGEGLSFAELMGRSTPTFAGDWWTVETPNWHIHGDARPALALAEPGLPAHG